MLNPHDRRDLASLGLMVLVYGLAVAPVLHAVVGHAGHIGGTGSVHSHGGQAHSHEAADERGLAPKPTNQSPEAGHGPDGHKHLTGSVEHLSVVATTWVVALVPVVRWVSWKHESVHAPTRLPGVPPRPTAMPQGP
ncbi:hypothetical protein LXT21_27775 [Myxococcus sp. K38C18041901]|uniref:hypothetical protein n=1 Tax=Myxococcus guangdongensis TaxID=2906760 RepID=UPI0020A794D6|nr:hypothetical protein [Myxococcus guangdongensis]MCP3062591.1 hypothetical protein [Myxococcus guangdongensis]